MLTATSVTCPGNLGSNVINLSRTELELCVVTPQISTVRSMNITEACLSAAYIRKRTYKYYLLQI